MKIMERKGIVGVIVLALAVICLWANPHCANAMEQNVNSVMEEEMTVAIIHSTSSQTLSMARATSGNGTVMGDGVRLRKKASSSSAVLELIYTGELVIVKKDSRPTWWQIQRCKTGTIGFVNRKYIDYWRV